MHRVIALLIGLVLIVLIVASWVMGGGQIIKTFDRTGKEIQLTVYLYQTQSGMVDAIGERLGYEVDPKHLGLAVYSPNDHICEVYALEPKVLDDERTKTIGHEVLHCLYGELHD